MWRKKAVSKQCLAQVHPLHAQNFRGTIWTQNLMGENHSFLGKMGNLMDFPRFPRENGRRSQLLDDVKQRRVICYTSGKMVVLTVYGYHFAEMVCLSRCANRPWLWAHLKKGFRNQLTGAGQATGKEFKHLRHGGDVLKKTKPWNTFRVFYTDISTINPSSWNWSFFNAPTTRVFTAHWGTTPSIGSIHFLGTCPNLPGMDSTGFYSVAGPLVAITRRRTFWIPWNRMGNSGLQVWWI